MQAIGAYTTLDAARDLQARGHWDRAAAVLADEHSPEALELTAEIRYERFLFRIDDSRAASAAIAALDPETPAARLLAGRLAYTRLVFQLDPRPDDDETAESAYRFASAHPETHGWAEFHWAVLLDNVRADAAAATPHYDEALRVARQDGDALLESIVLRHVAGQVIEGGDREAGVQLLRRSLHLRCAAGVRPQIAAAQLLLAGELPADDPERATLLETARALADELGLTWVRSGVHQLVG
jgi:hypothetical protein